MESKFIVIDQMDERMKPFLPAAKNESPSLGWIKYIRTGLGMSLQQLANKLNITKQSLQEIEIREQKGTVTINTLKDVAKAMDMKFVYGFVAIDGSVQELIDRKSQELATKIVSRTEQTMKLENQQNNARRIKKAIQERMIAIRNEMPKTLWN